jgi:uncharacterized protein (TIGR03435 family)
MKRNPRMKPALFVTMLLALISPALAQPIAQQLACAPPTTTTFDVASVKPSQVGFRSSHMRGAADSITASGSVFLILENAYDLRDFQIAGGPDWVRTATWDIVAKVDEPAPDWNNLRSDARNAIQHQRMAAVLAQRFNLKCHFETKELPVYNLIVAKGGSKLRPTPADAAKKGSLNFDSSGSQSRMQANGVELSTVAKMLSYGRGRIIVDKTGLTGPYDFTLTYTSDASAGLPATADTEPSGPTIFTALEEQLGLKLESAKGPVPVLVIDSISRPSEN